MLFFCGSNMVYLIGFAAFAICAGCCVCTVVHLDNSGGSMIHILTFMATVPCAQSYCVVMVMRG